MIKYSVQCQKGHGFEAWFQNGEAFDKQTKRGLVACPDCGSTKVTKALMAPHVAASTRKKGKSTPAGDRREIAAPPASVPQPVAAPAMALPAEMVLVSIAFPKAS